MSNMVVRTNMLALNSHRNLGMVSTQQARASARLSSGFRINSGADDAAGLGISENMRAQIRGLDQASRNAQDGISLVQTAEGGLSTINDMVIRIRELTVQAANDINTSETSPGLGPNESNRARIQGEINHLIDEIQRTATTLQFNSMTLLDGSVAGGSIGLANFNNPVNVNGLDIVMNATTGAAEIDTGATLDDAVAFGEALRIINSIGASNMQRLVNVLNDTNLIGGAIAWDDLGDMLADIGVELADQATAAATQAAINPPTPNSQMQESIHRGLVADLTWAIDTLTQLDSVLQASLAHPDNLLNGANIADWDGATDLGEFGQFVDDIFLTGTAPGVAGARPDIEFADGLWLQIGSNSAQGINVELPNVAVDVAGALRNTFNSPAFGMVTNVSDTGAVAGGDGESISALIRQVDAVLAISTAARGALGAIENRLEFTIQNLDVSSENLSASNSRIRDADMAMEMMRLTQANVLQQAATAMLAQGNQAPQSILQLLG